MIRALILGRHIFAAVPFALLLGACGTTNGDFGRVQPYLVTDGIHDWVGPYASGAKKASKFDLTDDERELRDLAYPLIEPPYDRQQWLSVAGEYGLLFYERGASFDRTAYFKRLVSADGASPLARYSPVADDARREVTRLLSTDDRSPSARYSRLLDDVRNDIARLPEFFETATRVLDIDQKRKLSLSHVSAVTPAERKKAELRISENAAIVSLVRDTLTQRVASYRYALERLVIESPYTQAADIERAIGRLNADIERYRAPAPTWTRGQGLASNQ